MARPEGGARTARRRYHGHGFALEIPAGWRDLSSYAFLGPELKDFAPVIAVQLEDLPEDADLERFVRPRLERRLRAASNAALTRRDRVRLGGGVEAVRVEIRAFAPDESRVYHRLLFVIANQTGFVLSCVLDRHTRLATGGAIDAVMASVRFPLGEAALRDEWTRADRFALQLPEGWSDVSTLLFAEPDARRFRRTLVLRREAGEAAADDEAEWAKTEIAVLERGLPGFELLSHRETATLDGGSAQLLSFRQAEKEKPALRHTELLAWRGGTRFTAMVTTEDDPPRSIERALLPVLRSLAAPVAAPESRA